MKSEMKKAPVLSMVARRDFKAEDRKRAEAMLLGLKLMLSNTMGSR